MYAVVYRFVVHAGSERAFCDAWAMMTELIYQHAGSLGSRLHRASEHEFVAYALWPSQAVYDAAADKVPAAAADPLRAAMQQACARSETLFRLPVVDDRLRGERAG